MSTATIVMLLAIIWFLIIPSFKARTFPVKKLIILPLVFMYLLYNSIERNFALLPTSYATIAAGVIAGIIIGYLVRRSATLTADKEKELIHLPGSFVSLAMFILIFSVHFVIGWMASATPGYFEHAGNVQLLLLFLMTAFSSLTLGLNGTLYYKYHNAESVELK